jgi:hypothetical protein
MMLNILPLTNNQAVKLAEKRRNDRGQGGDRQLIVWLCSQLLLAFLP